MRGSLRSKSFELIVCLAAASVGAQDDTQASSKQAKQPVNGAEIARLIEVAKSVSRSAYCPYSKFSVGAAVLTDSGDDFAGCNVENASYGLTICAERNAVFQMVAKSKQKIALVVIYTPTSKPTAPCGACRQVINEFGADARIIAVCDGKERIDTTLDKLLPDAFGPQNLSGK
jgi:cytidine deaminase